MNSDQYIEQLSDELQVIYEQLEAKYAPSAPISTKYNTPVNFKESLNTPIHRWYGYKEGFSPLFVKGFIEKYKTNQSPTIFDPFGGVGTTVLVASQMGLKAVSTDVNPLGNFVSSVKNEIYSDNDLDLIHKQIDDFKSKSSFERFKSIDNKTVESYFYEDTLDALIRVKGYVYSIANCKIRNLFRLAVLSLVSDISTHRKDGNGVKRKRIQPEHHTFVTLRDLVINKVLDFTKDIKEYGVHIQPEIISGSCIEPYNLPFKIDLVITSPPYANCFDYSKVYLSELWVGDFFKQKEDQKSFRESSVSSHVHYQWKRIDREFSSDIINNYVAPILNQKDLWNKKIPIMLQEYFADMGRCLKYISEQLNHNATVGFVVGNSVYSSVVIPTDLIIADIAERLGYSVKEITTYRKLSASSQQMKNIDEGNKKYLRESLIVLNWK